MTEAHFLVAEDKLRRLVAALALKPGERVLELGAGIGSVAAALPGTVRLTLVELEPVLVSGLRRRFPEARVIHGNALALLPTLPFEVLLSNLPHLLTDAVLDLLKEKSFRCAAVAVRAGAAPAGLERFGAQRLLELAPDDFSPRQPFASEVWLLRPLEPKKPAPEGW